jgi:hypothetical protein
MKKGWPFIFGAFLACAGSALAQTETLPPGAAIIQAGGASQTPSVCDGLLCCPPSGPNSWASGEALLWWLKSAPLPPTLTTFAPGSPSAGTGLGGALGVPGTTVLSPDHLGSELFLGGRFTLGGWLDSDQWFGLEANGFFLGNQSAGFSRTSAGTPPLRIPFANASPPGLFPPGESSFLLADPGVAAGGQFINSSLRFWGAEGNALFHAVNNESLSMSFLVGFRYIDLQEDLSILSNETLLVPPVASYTALDSFATRNQFYGGQLGVKAQTQFGRFDASLLAKVALGDNYQTVTVNGVSAVAGTGFATPPGVYPGGIFAQPTNIGQRTRNEFCVVPEVQLQIGYNVSSRIRAFAGYNFLYLSDVVRPGDQIDRALNFTSSAAISGVNPPAFTGAPRPEPLFNGSGFWAQGINVGIEFKF